MSGVLVLGGTTEARHLAQELVARGVAVTFSLAGRTFRPRVPSGEVRVGGFGGAAGLAAWLREHRPTVVVDATHPYADLISASARAACAEAAVPLLRLQRPGWTEGQGDRWHRVPDVDAAAGLVPTLGERAFLALGRGELEPFADVRDVWFLLRAVEPPAPPLPAHHAVVLARGPFALEAEVALLAEHRIDVVVTRDSGGSMTVPKLVAARDLRLPVIVVDRPPEDEAGEGVSSIDDALRWILSRAAR